MKTDSKTFGQLIDTLMQQGDVEMDSSGTAGRPVRLYKMTDQAAADRPG